MCRSAAVPPSTTGPSRRRRSRRASTRAGPYARWSSSPVQIAAHYAYQRFENASTGDAILKDTPRHKVYASFYYTKGWAEIGAWTQWVSQTLKDEGYVIVNPRVSARVRGWELSIQSYNLLEDEHVETANERGLDAETIGRSVSFRVSRTFGGK